MGQCIFCTEKATTKEHCIPKWMAGRTGLLGVFLENDEVIGSAIQRRHPVSFKSHRARLLCKGCQVHFKHLEDAVIPIYERLERYEDMMLSSDERTTLAQWTLKTTICVLFADGHKAIPESDRYELRKRGTVPNEAWVVFGRWNGIVRMATNEFAVGPPDSPTPYAYGLLLTTRRVATKCVVFYGKTGEPTEDLFPGQLAQAWPLGETPFKWPPAVAWDDFDLLNTYIPL